jgi:hypothetical protein
MPKKRQYNTVRTDYLEINIAHYEALKWYQAADVLRWLARDIAAPIDEAVIKAEAKRRSEIYHQKETFTPKGE